MKQIVAKPLTPRFARYGTIKSADTADLAKKSFFLCSGSS